MPTGNGQASFPTDEAAPPSHEAEAHEGHTHDGEDDGGLKAAVATVAVVAVGAAVFEAALLPGIAIGVAAVAAPKYLPRLAGALNPLFKSTVRGTYKLAQKSKEMFAEAQEQVHDIVAEVKAENEAADKEPAPKEPPTKHAA
jgi:Protein of unknown function (DUF5132)